MLARLLSILLLVAVPTAVPAADSLQRYEGEEKGYFFYKDPKKVPPKPEEPPAPPPQPKAEAPEPKKPEKPQPFSVPWLMANYDRIRLDAIEHPEDKDKVRAFLYVQRMILDKAQNFANAAHLVANTDPLLDETNRIPLDLTAKVAVIGGMNQGKKEALKHLAGTGGIFFFFDSACSYCTTQQDALESLAKDYNFSIKNISVDGRGLGGMRSWVRDEGQAKALGLKIMPTTVFVVPPNGYYIISQGYHAADTLGEKILMVAEAQKLLPGDLAKRIDVFNRGVMTAEDMRDPAMVEAAKEVESSTEWVKRLREKLEGRF